MDKNLIVIGSVNIDLIATASTDFFERRGADIQEWSEWSIDVGGTAGNFARIGSNLNIKTSLLGITGDDWAGQLAIEKFRTKNPNVEYIDIVKEKSTTGIVLLLYTKNTTHEPYRKVLGPRTSSIDEVDFFPIIDKLMKATDINRSIALIDGYFMRTRIDEFTTFIEILRENHIATALDVVPHEIWKEVNNGKIIDCLNKISHVSCELSTMERLLGILPNQDLPSDERALAMIAKFNGRFEKSTLYLRSGCGSFSDLHVYNRGHLKKIEYHTKKLKDISISRGDFLFVLELFNINQEFILSTSKLN